MPSKTISTGWRRHAGVVGVGLVITLWLSFGMNGEPKAESLFQKLIGSKKEHGMLNIAEKISHFSETVDVRGMVFSNDGTQLAIKSADETIRILNLANGNTVQVLRKDAGANSALTTTSMRYSPDGKLFLACHERSTKDVIVRIWDANTWKIVHDIVDPVPGGCAAIAFTPDGQYLLRASARNPLMEGDTLTAYDTKNWRPIWGIRTVPFYPTTMSLSPNGQFAAIGGEYIPGAPLPTSSQILLVNIRNHAVIKTIQETVSLQFGSLEWSPNGNQLAALGNDGINYNNESNRKPEHFALFNSATGDKIVSATWGRAGHRSLRYSGDGHYLLEGDMNGTETGLGLRIWDNQHSKLFAEISGNVGSIAVAPASRYFAIGVGKNIEVWKFK